MRAGQLLLLELDPKASTSLNAAGGKALVEAIQAEHPAVSLVVIDAFTALTGEIPDESRAPLEILLARTGHVGAPHCCASTSGPLGCGVPPSGSTVTASAIASPSRAGVAEVKRARPAGLVAKVPALAGTPASIVQSW